MTRAQIIGAIGNPHLKLYRGDGYFYFVYDDGKDRWEDHAVYVYRLNHLSYDKWIAEGLDFLKKVLCNT
jgi:hypothetical protein